MNREPEHPRVRGEEAARPGVFPHTWFCTGAMVVSSPRTRGCSDVLDPVAAPGDLFRAHAGVFQRLVSVS
ncbi:hypothetical protein Ade02nite_60110 [Paractinoplanes deccanensis]|uniref:Uncharacterized protein n=1 Tax=Paractinoplanes deccanensis TaxID=113561 RepID=A0ABQ3YC61_9ACTN|nr:hypothetical protein Ade02nite_60110 [Actinoplanes deccanensis]